jgi:hypothetical protein
MFAFLSRVAIACLFLFLSNGCANYIFRSFDLDGGDSLSLDAKQRLVLVTHKGGKSGSRRIVCAEPSPDAFSATSASASASTAFTFPTLLPGGQTGNAGGGGGIAGGTSESAASIAMRTQTIQLLRDGLYRACEAYMNGAIDQNQYNIILLNIDKLMVTLLGIDAIGGTPKAPAVAISAVAPRVSTNASASKDGTPSASGDVGADGDKPQTTIFNHSTDPTGVQAEAIANIVLAANFHSSTPALCISLLASGELNHKNPGQHSVLKSCDYLLHGAVRKAVASPHMPPPDTYRATHPPVARIITKPEEKK